MLLEVLLWSLAGIGAVIVCSFLVYVGFLLARILGAE